MGSLSAAMVIGAFLATLTFDISVNTAQEWYGSVYSSAFWSSRAQDSPALRDLRAEEEAINAILGNGSGFEQVELSEVTGR